MATEKRTTISDVSRYAGVSQGTVSVVLSGRESNIGVSDATRQRVLEAVKRLGYKPSIQARGLARNKSFLIAFLCRRMFAWTLPDLIPGIQTAMNSSDYSLIIYFHEEDPDSEAHYINMALEREVDGIILGPAWTLDGRSNEETLTSLKSDNFPVVQIFGHLFPGLASVRMDYLMIGYLACRHLIDLGHRSIVHLTHDDYLDEESPGAREDAKGKWEGYKKAMIEAGLEPVVIAQRIDKHPATKITYMNIGLAAGEEILNHPSRPTGVVAYNDWQCIGLMQWLGLHGIEIPKDISIIGADNMEEGIVAIPPLTTMGTLVWQMGNAAGQMVLELADGKQVSDRIFPPEIVIRESTARPKGL